MLTGGLHLPTAIIVLLGCLIVGGIIAWRRRSKEPEHSFISDVDRATYETLHRVSLAAKPLREGLTEDGAARAARHLLDMLHASAVAIQGVNRTLAWVGGAMLPDLDTSGSHAARVWGAPTRVRRLPPPLAGWTGDRGPRGAA